MVFFDQLLERTRALPDVANATLTSRPPLRWEDQNGRFHIEGRPIAASAPMCCVASHVIVGEGFFETLGLPILRGRTLGPADHEIDSPAVAVIDEAAAERWWPGEDPVGQRIRFASDEAPWFTVVGVVGNITYDGPGEVWPTYYHSHNQTVSFAEFMTRSSYLTARTTGDAARLLPAIRQITSELDPNLAIAGSFTQEEVLAEAVVRPRFIMSLLSLFAAVALSLGAIGIYGVMSYGVALRAGELGIRRALGAGSHTVVGMVLKQGFLLAALGVVLGLGGAVALTRIMVGFLHEVSPTDPVIYLLVAAGVVAVALLAAFVPARRAGGVDPLDALRVE